MLRGRDGRRLLRRRTATVLVAVTCAAAGLAVQEASAARADPAQRWIVTLTPGLDPLGIAQSIGVTDVKTYTEAFTGFVAMMTDEQALELGSDDRVQSIQKDRVVAHRHPGGDNPNGDRHLDDSPVPSTQAIPNNIRRVGALASPTARIDGRDQRVDADIAVIDGGVQQHNDLNLYRSVDCTGEGITTDTDGHGTMVAGVAAAIDNRIGVVGVAPGARLWSVRVFDTHGSATESALLCGIDYTAAHANEIDTAVMSFVNEGSVAGPCGRQLRPSGGLLGILPKYEVVDPFHAAICTATARGVAMVAAAGNDAKDVSNVVPAAYPEVITASGLNDTDGMLGGRGTDSCFPGEADDNFATFSNYGKDVDIAAPATCIATTSLNNRYAVADGTSFAAPAVAGAVALLKAKTPFTVLPTLLVKQLLQLRGEHYPMPGDPDGIHEPILNVRGL